jgi:hypothetical protein
MLAAEEPTPLSVSFTARSVAIMRIRHSHKELPAQFTNRRQLVSPRHFPGHQTQHVLGHAHLGKVDGGGVQATPHGNDHVLLRHVFFVREQLEQSAALLFLEVEHLRELSGQEQALLDEDVGDAFPK